MAGIELASLKEILFVPVVNGARQGFASEIVKLGVGTGAFLVVSVREGK